MRCKCSLGVLILNFLALGQTDPVRIQIDDFPFRTNLRGFGMNLGSRTFWDAGQYTKNLIHRNPGFEGLLYQSLVRCSTVDSNGCVIEGGNDAWPAGFWNAATCEIATGTAQGWTGTIGSYRAGTPNGARLEIAALPRGFANGDSLILRKQSPADPAAGWWLNVAGGATVTPEQGDLPPNTPGRQAARISALSPLMEVRIASLFDTLPGQSFVRLNGRYRLSFRAKGLAGLNILNLSVARFHDQSASFYLDESRSLLPVWQDFEYLFNVAEAGAITGPVRLLFRVEASELLLDDVVLEQIDGDPANYTAFTDPMVKAIEELKPGILRFWADQLGESLDNQIAPPLARQRAGYSAWLKDRDEINYGIHEFLELCERTGADPWIVVPLVYSATEAANLIEYLAGPAESPYGSQRAARGHTAPWTSAFSKIHLEFGNEAWNGVFRGGNLEHSASYGARAQTIFAAMRRAPAFDSGKFDLIIGGQAVWTGRNREIQAACNNNDTFAIAPYMMYEVNAWSNHQQLFAPLFAESEMNCRTGVARQNRDMLNAFPRPIPLAVYEINLHTTGGSISQEALDALTPSLGAGIAVANSMLQMLRDLDIRDQVFYSLPQIYFQRGDGKKVRLWGAVIDMGVTNRRRPQYLALQLVNRAMSGATMIVTSHSTEPSWEQPELNGVALTGARYLQSFAFQRPGGGHAAVLFNLHLTDSIAVTFSGAVPTGDVTIGRLEAGSAASNNEDSINVTVRTLIDQSFNPDSPFVLAPHSLTVLTWSDPPTAPQDGQGANHATQH